MGVGPVNCHLASGKWSDSMFLQIVCHVDQSGQPEANEAANTTESGNLSGRRVNMVDLCTERPTQAQAPT